jgi:Tfp pilus assembly protein PilO
VNRLEELPLIQKIVLVVLSLALVGGGFYFLLLTEAQSQITAKRAELNNYKAEAEKLAPFKVAERREKLIAQENAEIARIEQHRRMLPTQDELPGFIDSVKADADAVGLQIMKVDVGETELADYYAKIPIRMSTVGTFPKFAAFLRTLAAPSKRIANVRDISLDRLTPSLSQLEYTLGENDLTRRIRSFLGRRDAKSPEFNRLISIMQLEAIHTASLVTADFTVYAYSYTGKPAPEDSKKGGSKRRTRS